MGGFSGLSILLGELLSVNTSLLVTILNLLSLAVGFLFLGWGVGRKTVYCTLLYTAMVNVFEWLCPIEAGTNLTGEIVLELIAASLLGAPSARDRFSSAAAVPAGTDILALVVRKFTSADISICMMAADGLIVGASFFVFDVKTGICSVIGMLIKTSLVQTVVDSFKPKEEPYDHHDGAA